MIALHAAGRSYTVGGRTLWALRPTTLTIGVHELVVVLGPSGSGKTTLLNLVGGLDQPTHGRVVVGDEEVSSLDRAALARYRRSTTAVVFQAHNLVPHLTVRENIELAAELVGRTAHVDDALRSVGLDDRAGHFPSELSGGEQQRVAVARSLVKAPAVLLADEPTGSLDVDTGRQVVKLLAAAHARGCCVVIVTHNAAIARAATRVITMRGGEVTADAPNASPTDVDALDW
ncbi:MAG: ABC transporter ATP-binding protein [Proteobacteria bacterium]|nr:ABC transporter ATP-binding protein [Pseudomonadota bacterium]